MAVVYIHQRISDGEIFYVGIGKNNNGNRSKVKNRGDHWKKYTNKHPYIIRIIHSHITYELAKQIEIGLIREIGRHDLGLGPLVNKTNGGDGSLGLIVSKETRDKRSKSLKGRIITEEARKKLSLHFKGRKRPEEVTRKANETKKNNPFIVTDEYRKKLSDAQFKRWKKIKEGNNPS